MADPSIIDLDEVTGRSRRRRPQPREAMLDQLLEDHALAVNAASLRASASITKRMAAVLDTLQERRSVAEVGDRTKKNLDRAIRESQEVLAEATRDTGAMILVESEEAARDQVRRMAETLTSREVLGVPLQLPSSRLSATQFREAVEAPIFGWGTHQWVEWHTARDAMTIDRELRAAYFAGEGIPEVVRRLADVTTATRRELTVTARTAIQTTGNRTAESLYQANSDVIGSMVWTATLDNRTCPQCGPLDGTEIPLRSQRIRPPAHPQCRCFLAPQIKEGILPGANVKPPTWSQWITGDFGGLSDERVERRQREVLGATTARLIQAGKIRPGDLVTATGRRRTVAELKAKVRR